MMDINRHTLATLSSLVWLGLCAMSVIAAPLASAAGPSLETRVSKLERILNTGTLVELLNRVDALQGEVQELRGEIEQQRHTLDQLKQHQRELYLDVDRRMRRFESGGEPVAGPVETPPPTVPPAPVSPAVKPPPPVVPPVTTQKPVTVAVPAAPVPAAPVVDPVLEQSAYQRAFNLLKEGRYESAGKAFKKFLSSYPQGRFTDNAQYWLGEAYYVTRQFAPALKEFNTLIEQHPDSPKLTHALLKVGYIHHELGESDKAVKALEQLMANHPNTTAARLARERLQRIKKGSR